MGYVFRVRLASFFTGVATVSFAGLYVLYKDYKIAHHAISNLVKGLHELLDARIYALEQLRQSEASQQPEEAE